MASKPTGNPIGRPPIFKTPEELLNKWEKYKANCTKPKTLIKGETPVTVYTWINKNGFLNYAKLHTNFFTDYSKKPEFSWILDKIEQDCKQYLIDMGLNGLYNYNIVKLVASTHYGMSEKNVVSGDPDNPLNINVSINSLLDDVE